MIRKNFFLAFLLLFNILPALVCAQKSVQQHYLTPVNPILKEKIKTINTVDDNLDHIIKQLEEKAHKINASKDEKIDLAAFILRKVSLQRELPYETNENLLLEASELVPDNFYLEMVWGDAYFFSGDYENSINHYETALSLEPENFEITSRCGIAHLNALRYEKALEYLEICLDKTPKNYYFLYYAGICELELRNFDESIEYLEKALELVPEGNLKVEIEEVLSKAKEAAASNSDFTQDEDQHFIISFAGNSKEDLGDMAFDSLNDIYDDVTTLLDCDPDVKVNVNFFLTDEYYNENKDWSAASTSGLKIDVPLKSGYKSEEYVKGLLAHEFTHAIINLKTNNRAPLWVHEGLAQYEEFRTQYGSEETLRSDFVSVYEKDFIEKDFFIPLDRIPNYMGSNNNRDVNRAYVASWIAIRCMTDLYGESSVATLLNSMSKGNDIHQAVSEVTGGSYKDFEDEIKLWIKNQ